jgi:hypothetical protein
MTYILTQKSRTKPADMAYKVPCLVYNDIMISPSMYKCGVCVIHLKHENTTTRFQAPFSTGRNNSSIQIIYDLAYNWMTRAISIGFTHPDSTLILAEVVYFGECSKEELEDKKLGLSLGYWSVVGNTAKHGN